jgi:HEPN domain-containing protein
LAQAEDDYAYGCVGVGTHSRGAAWNFHQAAEKAIKAVLIRKEIDFPRTHDLPRLLTVLDDDSSGLETVREAAFVLSSFLPLTKYPGDWPEINESRAKEAQQVSEIILNWALEESRRS